MITLATPVGVATIDPANGAEVGHFGRTAAPEDNILASYDWEVPHPADRGPGYGSTRDDWHSRYRGGWQLATPNAGPECVVDGVRHPYHGEVSRSRWHVVDQAPDATTLRVGTHGPLVVTRRLVVSSAACRLTVTTVLENPTPIPAHAVLVEHLALRGADDGRVVAPSESRWAPAAQDPRVGQAEPTEWRDGTGLGGPIERGASRLHTLRGGNEGWVEFDRPDRVVRVEWDPEMLPSLWYWREHGSPGFPWFGRADIVGLEPASVSEPHGLARAIERGDAFRIGPGQRLECRISVLVTHVR